VFPWNINVGDNPVLSPYQLPARKDEEAEFFQIADGDMRAWEDDTI
jgi:hypothetical protein